jgi:hypothetical protein
MNNPQRQLGVGQRPLSAALKELNITYKVITLFCSEHHAPSGLIIIVVPHPQLALGVINIQPHSWLMASKRRENNMNKLNFDIPIRLNKKGR